MAAKGQPYTSGHWVVKAGEEEEFVKRWTQFTEWSQKNAAGAETFGLIQDANDSRRFLSFGAWTDADSVDAWRGSEEFRQQLGRCREVCEEFEAHDYLLVAGSEV
jgi:heme-degrading monooxygenase HmoA